MVTVSTINRLSRAVDQIENWSQQGRLKIVQVRRAYEENSDQALDRHYAPTPKIGARISRSSSFCDDEEMADESRD
jgi:hypothetical protein